MMNDDQKISNIIRTALQDWNGLLNQGIGTEIWGISLELPLFREIDTFQIPEDDTCVKVLLYECDGPTLKKMT